MLTSTGPAAAMMKDSTISLTPKLITVPSARSAMNAVCLNTPKGTSTRVSADDVELEIGHEDLQGEEEEGEDREDVSPAVQDKRADGCPREARELVADRKGNRHRLVNDAGRVLDEHNAGSGARS